MVTRLLINGRDASQSALKKLAEKQRQLIVKEGDFDSFPYFPRLSAFNYSIVNCVYEFGNPVLFLNKRLVDGKIERAKEKLSYSGKICRKRRRIHGYPVLSNVFEESVRFSPADTTKIYV
ncbi:hypothetical protein ES332_A05G279600v1 [Gossypium tomentosum]|uniref:Uncharacterized protein n=1 Tax=Gossypium tomentosum TaxID=34277 RepID=A0A5D2QLA0_GOSTO|nr:hypothetical protein ES332_A05G279600v1 [Gossypium tomentosum]